MYYLFLHQIAMRTAIVNATVINEGHVFRACVIIDGEIIQHIDTECNVDVSRYSPERIIDAEGMWLMPGVIDEHVHFREPGLEHKGDIRSESKAAVAGGITSFMDMPNTQPQTTTIERLEAKQELARQSSLANYAFYLGATNDNLDEITKVDPLSTCGIKIFMGSSTGNMLVDNEAALEQIFELSPILIAAHCEDESIIGRNTASYKQNFANDGSYAHHAEIRDENACYASSSKAVALAQKHGARLHVLHISTARELQLFSNNKSLKSKQISAEVCVNHLWFSSLHYNTLGWRIKCNPSIKSETDRRALLQGVRENLLDVVATDHAPHLIEEKNRPILQSASGIPMVQHALPAMIELSKRGNFPITTVVQKMCHAPAIIFGIKQRGFIRQGYFADLVLVQPNAAIPVTKKSLLYKCGWNPFEGKMLESQIVMTIVNGRVVYDNGKFDESVKGKALEFSPRKSWK